VKVVIQLEVFICGRGICPPKRYSARGLKMAADIVMFESFQEVGDGQTASTVCGF
jgi:hypothetical protein